MKTKKIDLSTVQEIQLKHTDSVYLKAVIENDDAVSELFIEAQTVDETIIKNLLEIEKLVNELEQSKIIENVFFEKDNRFKLISDLYKRLPVHTRKVVFDEISDYRIIQEIENVLGEMGLGVKDVSKQTELRISLINLIKSVEEKILNFSDEKHKPVTIPKELDTPEEFDEDVLLNKMKFNPRIKKHYGKDDYKKDYLNDIYKEFNPQTQKNHLGGVCYLLHKEKIFKINSFSELLKLLSYYWKIPLPKDKRPNKYKAKADELEHFHPNIITPY